MKVFTYSEARQNLSKLLVLAQDQEVEIRRKDGSRFSLRAKRTEPASPFDVLGIDSAVSTTDVLEAVRESSEGCCVALRAFPSLHTRISGHDLGFYSRPRILRFGSRNSLHLSAH